MQHKLWSAMIAGGLLVAGAGWHLVDAGPSSAVAAMLLLTAGLLSCLAGLVGASGLMAWLPALQAAPVRVSTPE